MLKQIVVPGVALVLALAILPARCSADVDDTAVDQLFSALRDKDFSGATAHFSARMKAALSPATLEAAWSQTYAAQGPLLSWKILDRQNLPGGDEVSVQLTFQSSTAISTLAVASQTGEIGSLFFKLAHSNAPVTAPPYAEQAKFHSEDVTVGGYKLPGTLTIPNGKGPFPAVVLVHGSGPNDRNETIGANHPFADIADGLSSQGIAVLRYDKRTLMHSVMVATVEDEVIDDAVAAVQLLRARPDVLGDRIFVVGHSLGAVLAPEIAKKAWPVAGIVLLAPSGRKLPQIIVQQARFLGQASPAQLAELERQADELSAHKMPPSETFLGATASYFYDLDARDEVAIARSLDVPILILHGGRDYQVIDEDIRIWQNGLKGDAKVRVETFPSLNHLFIAGEGKPGPAEYDTPGHVDRAVIGTIASFIENGGGPPARQAASN
ncbi:MAG TPA: alpha/beta fold hydrolase [Candidatus Binatus sp.]|uniref:alpha/beta hydrolase n=1 Tax=Candidatus Binatus sp. TaxID=2811406 RepID=UPI002F41FD26